MVKSTTMKLTIKLTKPLLLGISGLFSLILFQCSPEINHSTSVKPPFITADVQNELYLVDHIKGDTINTPSGASIILPPKCFVHFDGSTVDGEVQISFRQFHSESDLILSGIPMAYAEKGQQGALVTAGMIEFRATSQGKELRFDEGKSAEIEIPSHLDDPNVAFYTLDEKTGEWQEKGTQQKIENPKALAIQAELDTLNQILEPAIPKTPEPGTQVYELDLSRYLAENRGLSQLLWQFAGGDDYPNPSELRNFNFRNYQATQLEIVDPELLTVEITFTPKNLISLDLKTNDTSVMDKIEFEGSRKIVTLFKPVLTGRALKNAKEAYKAKKKEFEEAQKRIDLLTKQREQIAELKRRFTINNMGFFNCDVFIRRPYTFVKMSIYHNGSELSSGTRIFQVVDNAVQGRPAVLETSYTNEQVGTKLIDELKNSLLVVLPGDKMAVIPSYTLNQIKDDGKGRIDLNQVVSIKEKEDMDKLIAGINE